MRHPWQRLLWLKQNYPDNYTDPAFLRELENFKKNQLKPHITSSYAQVAFDFLLFYHRLLNTALTYVIFSLFYYYHYDPFILTGSLTTLAFIIASCPWFRTIEFKSSLIIIFTMLTLSPVLKSLSRTTSSDSIWTLSCWLTVFYLLSVYLQESSIISTNLLVANVAVLSSRLNSTTDVFCFVLICIEVNILLPYFEHNLLMRKLYVPCMVSFLMNNVVIYSFVTYSMGWKYTTLLIFFTVIFVVVLPRYFILWQRWYHRGDELLGTWDAKKPVLD
ncbi:LAFE_0G14114g1_1 [Lachancea fermentati]|uniref:LAFE_0G14114g1_1 n=1 Tax=Lachancea fermentati TaxID=4955 RepID=A0A1G4MID7_LACFM|nr:LAFE_0G14114g1_1 [Lachancea fermentati]